MGRSQELLLLLSYEMHSLLVAGWEYLCTTSAVDTGMHLRRLSSMPKMDVARISGSKLVSVPNSREMASQAEWSPASDWTACQSGVGEKKCTASLTSYRNPRGTRISQVSAQRSLNTRISRASPHEYSPIGHTLLNQGKRPSAGSGGKKRGYCKRGPSCGEHR